MATRKVFHCLVDDTALITNISEIKNWVSQGLVTLIIPLYTLERLHVLKKDASQIGINGREAVKFLDRVTSGKDGLSIESIAIQGPDEQYATWAQVEEHLVDAEAEPENGILEAGEPSSTSMDDNTESTGPALEKSSESAGRALSQMLLNKLNFAKDPETISTGSSPPTSPMSSGPQSSKTSPEVKAAKLVEPDQSIVPPALKPLINSVVWYTYQKPVLSKGLEILFLTNAADTASLARGFGIIPKNIHQIRTLISLEEQEIKNHTKYQKKHPSSPSTATFPTISEPKPLFKYEDGSDDEEVVFKPRGHGVNGHNSARGSPTTSHRGGRSSNRRSPAASFSTPNKTTQKKPEIPTEEIDPDSFDRGGFARGSTPLANTISQPQGQFHGSHRGHSHRGNSTPTTQPRGGFHRGNSRGFERGTVRGRGKLFVP